MTLKIGTHGTAHHPASGVETAAMVIGLNGDDTVWLALFPVAGSLTERVRLPAGDFTPAGAVTPPEAPDVPAEAPAEATGRRKGR